MSTSVHSAQEFAGQRTSFPAWLLSVVVHMVAVLLLAMLAHTVSKGVVEEPGRTGSIVLAKQSESGAEFFDEADVEADGQGEATSDASSSASEQEAVEMALPEGDPATANDVFPDLKLPGGESIGGGQDLLATPSLSVSADTRILPRQGDAEILAAEARRKRPSGPVGPPAQVALFGSAPAQGHTFVFVLDRSKSMGGRGLGVLPAAEAELTAALSLLKENHRFEVIAYHDRPVYFSSKYFERKQLVIATEANLAKVKGFFGGLAPFGRTEHAMALKAALWLKPDVVFLLTDGGDPPPNPYEMSNIRKLAVGRTTIHCIQFGSGKRQTKTNFMETLARETAGGYGYVNVSRRRRSP